MKPRKKPNIVLVITDDQGYGDLGCTGNPVVRTPYIDSFSEQSARLADFHVGPTCAPTRAGLLTGHYANSTGVWHTIGGRSLLRRDEWSLAAALQENGWRTGLFGKWHLGDDYPYRPQDRGFETVVVHGGGGIGQTPDYWGNDYFDDTYFVNGLPRKFQGYCTDVFFGEAMRFIDEHRGDPFFCYIATNAPHTPYNVEERYRALYDGLVPDARARFYGMITNIDENFGRLRHKLQELNLERDTILIFMTDNGTSGGATVDLHGYVKEGFNAGLRGLKNSPYDGGHRVPFFIRWPAGGLAQDADIRPIAANIDVMPTLLELSGIPVPEGRSFHGRSLKPLLEDPDASWEARVIVTDSQRVAKPIKWRQSAVMTDRWRLINGAELYDAAADREQRDDVAEKHPDVVLQLRDCYEDWWSLVSERIEEEIPIPIGTFPLQTTVLTCHDWRNEDGSSPWHQGFIRQAMLSDGYWEIEVAADGEYIVEARRWPVETGLSVRHGIDGDDVEWNRADIEPGDWNMYTGGLHLPIVSAALTVGELTHSASVSEQEQSASFRLSLQEGTTTLQCTFTCADGRTLGAYYVYVMRLTPHP